MKLRFWCLRKSVDLICRAFVSFLTGIDVSLGDTVASWIRCSFVPSRRCLHGSSACLGSDGKAKSTSSVDEPLNTHSFQVPSVSSISASEDFWTISSCNIEYSALQSRESISSICTSNPTLDSLGISNANTSSEFVNHGLILWNQTRHQWLRSKKSKGIQQLHEHKLSWNATYDSLLNCNKPFPKPIPLSEMVDFLVDIWEQEGVYD